MRTVCRVAGLSLALVIPSLAAAGVPPSPAPAGPPAAAEGGSPPASDPAPAAPYPMAEFSVTDLDGRTVDSQQLRGKVVLIDIWATWCGPCVAAAPLLDEAYRNLKGKGLEMIGIAVPPKASPDEVRAAARRLGMNYPVAIWNAHLAERIQGLRAVPTYILVAPDWTVHKLWVGATPPGLIRREIESLLAPAAAAAEAAAAATAAQ